METIEVTSRHGGIVTVTLNRPEKKNAINGQMWDELLADVPRDRAHRRRPGGGAHRRRRRVLLGRRPLGEPDPSVEAAPPDLAPMRHVGDVVPGPAPPAPADHRQGAAASPSGAGCNLALGCDLIVAADDARFSEIFAKRGLVARLRRLVAAAPADRPAPGQGAGVLRRHHRRPRRPRRLGLVNRVVPAGELDAFVDDWAHAPGRRARPSPWPRPSGCSTTPFQVTLEQALEDEGAAQTVNFATTDTPEAIAAFLEKRTPVFKGL